MEKHVGEYDSFAFLANGVDHREQQPNTLVTRAGSADAGALCLSGVRAVAPQQATDQPDYQTSLSNNPVKSHCPKPKEHLKFPLAYLS